MKVSVRSPGWLTSVQDGGRHGLAAIGIGSSGAMDPVALRLANALVGNAPDAAALEMTLRGPRLQFDAPALIAITGAEIEVRCGEQAVPTWRPVWIAGGEVDFGAMRRGARACLAIAGGIDVAPVLGSRSVDVNTALGPCGGRALLADDVLETGSVDVVASLQRAIARRAIVADRGPVAAARWSLDPRPWFDAAGEQPLALMRGTHFDALDAASRVALFAQPFRVGNESNRVGTRLENNRLRLAAPLELVSEGVVPGTVQLPPNGDPIALMSEGPTTGGYPRIGHVAAVDLPILAQRRPGTPVRFVETTLAEAQSRLQRREQRLLSLVQNIRDRIEG